MAAAEQSTRIEQQRRRPEKQSTWLAVWAAAEHGTTAMREPSSGQRSGATTRGGDADEGARIHRRRWPLAAERLDPVRWLGGQRSRAQGKPCKRWIETQGRRAMSRQLTTEVKGSEPREWKKGSTPVMARQRFAGDDEDGGSRTGSTPLP